MKVDLTKRQTIAWDYLTSMLDIDLCYGGAKGGGKSFLLCLWAFTWAKWLQEFFGIKANDHPLPVGFIGRKRASDFSDTTFETWKKVIPSEAYTIRQMDKEIVIDNAVKIMFGGLDDQANIQKFNSAELAFIALDQAEETSKDDISVLEGSLRLTHNGKVPPYKSLYTANPRAGWLKDDFVKGKRDGAIFVKALPADNPHLPDSYEERLKTVFGYNSALLQAYLYGEWDVFEGMYFEEFDRNYHVYNPHDVKILPSWPRVRSVDWGYSSPMSCNWHAIGPDQHIYTYREYYETKKLDVMAAKEVASLTSESENVLYTVGDPQSFPVKIEHWKQGRSVAVKRSDVWAENGVPMIMGNSARVDGWSRMREYLRLREYQGGQSAWWHISSECPNLIREVTSAYYDKRNIEDIAPECSDHSLENCRLFFMSRPPLWKDKPETMTMLEAAEKQAEREEESKPHRLGAF